MIRELFQLIRIYAKTFRRCPICHKWKLRTTWFGCPECYKEWMQEDLAKAREAFQKEYFAYPITRRPNEEQRELCEGRETPAGENQQTKLLPGSLPPMSAILKDP